MRGNERGMGQGASNYALQQRAAQRGGRATALRGLRLVAFAALHRLAHRFDSGLDARGIGDGEQLHALVVQREEGVNRRTSLSSTMTRFIYALKEIRACLEAEILTDVQQRLAS